MHSKIDFGRSTLYTKQWKKANIRKDKSCWLYFSQNKTTAHYAYTEKQIQKVTAKKPLHLSFTPRVKKETNSSWPQLSRAPFGFQCAIGTRNCCPLRPEDNSLWSAGHKVWVNATISSPKKMHETKCSICQNTWLKLVTKQRAQYYSVLFVSAVLICSVT